MDKERRYLKTELRATRDDSGATIEGYAAKYNVISEDLGGFREVLLPGCFELYEDIVCNREHNDDDPLGRTISGTLKVETDDIGLVFRCSAPNTTLGRDTVELISRGDINSCSFAFIVENEDDEEWGETEDGQPLRSIKRCTVYDVACVTHPAYPQTELALRSLNKALASKQSIRSKTNLLVARWKARERNLLPPNNPAA
jgi:HK97 family phage prohead protease